MKAVIIETRLWYCDICDETIIFGSWFRHIISKFHKHKKEYGIDAEEHEFVRPEHDEVNYILNDTIKDCRNKYFHSFDYRCVYDNKFTNMEKSEKIILSITLEYMKYKSQVYRLSEKIKTSGKNCFRFNEIVNSTIKTDSSLSYINKRYFSKFPMPIRYRQFVRIIPQTLEYFKSVCIARSNLFHFACRRWTLYWWNW